MQCRKPPKNQIGLQSVKTCFGAYDNLGAEIATLASSPESPSIVMVTIDLDYFSGGIYSPKWGLAEVINESFKRGPRCR